MKNITRRNFVKATAGGALMASTMMDKALQASRTGEAKEPQSALYLPRPMATASGWYNG